jgi:hypothetical protein
VSASRATLFLHCDSKALGQCPAMLEHVRRPLAFLTWQCARLCVAAASTAAACFQSFSFHTVKPEPGALR